MHWGYSGGVKRRYYEVWAPELFDFFRELPAAVLL
jgi:hypothetical protein